MARAQTVLIGSVHSKPIASFASHYNNLEGSGLQEI